MLPVRTPTNPGVFAKVCYVGLCSSVVTDTLVPQRPVLSASERMHRNPEMETSGRSVTVAALQIEVVMAVSLQTQHLASWHRLPKATQIRKDHEVTCIRVHA